MGGTRLLLMSLFLFPKPTTILYIAAIGTAAQGKPPRKVPNARRDTLLAGLEPMVIAA